MFSFANYQSYLAQVNKFCLLAEDEEKNLTSSFFASKDPKLAQKLINHNLRLVIKIANEYSKKCPPDNCLDLIQEGNAGLIQGVWKYNPSFQVPLAHYCAKWIHAYIIRFIMNNVRLVKVGTTKNQRKLFFNLSKQMAKLNSLGVELNDSQVAENLAVQSKDVAEMRVRLSSDAENSLEFGVFSDILEAKGCAPDEMLEQEQEKEQLKLTLSNFKGRLNEIETIVFERRLLADDPETLESIGKSLNVTKEWIRQVEVKVKTKLVQYLS